MRLPTLLLCAALAGCAGASDNPGSPGAPDATDAPEGVEAAEAPAGDGLPLDALPGTDRNGWVDCPYLDTQWVADTNGQRVTGVGIDERFNPPACQYWSYPPEPQLTVFVRRMPTAQEAMAVVDWAMPIDTTAPADQPEGWNGGRHGGGDVPGRLGAGYAVAHGDTAVVVFTNQNESVKAQLVAEQVIANLGL